MTLQSFKIGLASDVPAVQINASHPAWVCQPSLAKRPNHLCHLTVARKESAGNKCLQDNTEEAFGLYQRVVKDMISLRCCNREVLILCQLCGVHDTSTNQAVVSNWLHSAQVEKQKKIHTYFTMCKCLLSSVLAFFSHCILQQWMLDLIPKHCFHIYFLKSSFIQQISIQFLKLTESKQHLGHISTLTSLWITSAHSSSTPAAVEPPAARANFFWLVDSKPQSRGISKCLSWEENWTSCPALQVETY